MDAPAVTSGLMTLPADDMAYYYEDFKRAKTANNTDRLRCIRSMMAYTGLDAGQWDDALKSTMFSEGRDPKTYNFIRFLVAGHAGNYIMNSVDPTFVDREDDSIDTLEATDVLQKKWYSMKDRGRYKSDTMLCIENGLVYCGTQELVIMKPSLDPRTWYIAFPSLRPDLVFYDPNVTGDNISRTARKAFKRVFLTARQAMQIYPKKAAEIEKKVFDSLAFEQDKYEILNIDSFRADTVNRLGNKHECIEILHIEDEKTITQIHVPSAQEIPQTKHIFNSVEDITTKKLWAMKQGIELRDEDIYTTPQFKPINKITTFCPDLGVLLENGDDERQLEGHLPLYSWSFLQKYGKFIGLVYFLIDAQQDLNKREMAKTKLLTQTPLQKFWISEDVEDVEGQRMDEVVADFADSSKPIKAPAGVPGNMLVGSILGASNIGSLVTDENIKIDFMNRIAALPIAMQGMTERTGESGILHGRKVIEGTIMNRIPQEWVMQHEHDKAEDWVKVVLNIFQDVPNIPITNSDNKETVVANEIVGFDDNGNIVQRRSLKNLKRVEVIITLTKENDFMKQAKKEMAVASLQAMPPTATNPPIRAAFECALAVNMDFTDDIEKEKAVKAAELSYRLAMSQGELALMQIDAKKMQMQTQMAGGMPPVGQPSLAPPQPSAPKAEKPMEPPSTRVEAAGRPSIPQTPEIGAGANEQPNAG
jgi:hypothetical protein